MIGCQTFVSAMPTKRMYQLELQLRKWRTYLDLLVGNTQPNETTRGHTMRWTQCDEQILWSARKWHYKSVSRDVITTTVHSNNSTTLRPHLDKVNSLSGARRTSRLDDAPQIETTSAPARFTTRDHNHPRGRGRVTWSISTTCSPLWSTDSECSPPESEFSTETKHSTHLQWQMVACTVWAVT